MLFYPYVLEDIDRELFYYVGHMPLCQACQSQTDLKTKKFQLAAIKN